MYDVQHAFKLNRTMNQSKAMSFGLEDNCMLRVALYLLRTVPLFQRTEFSMLRRSLFQAAVLRMSTEQLGLHRGPCAVALHSTLQGRGL